MEPFGWLPHGLMSATLFGTAPVDLLRDDLEAALFEIALYDEELLAAQIVARHVDQLTGRLGAPVVVPAVGVVVPLPPPPPALGQDPDGAAAEMSTTSTPQHDRDDREVVASLPAGGRPGGPPVAGGSVAAVTAATSAASC